MMNKIIKDEIKRLVKRYNVLACPKSGVLRLIMSGNPREESE